MDHVFAEFFSTGVGIVVGALPIDGGIFVNDFVLAGSGDSDSRYVGETAQAMMILRSASELNYFERATQIHIEALLF